MTSGEAMVDPTVVMLATTVILCSAPASLSFGSTLFPKICRLYRDCLESEHTQVQVRALQSLCSVFRRSEICAPFIREMGQWVFAKIRPFVLVPRNEAGDETLTETDLPVLQDLTDDELTIIQEAFKTVEAVLGFSQEEKGWFFEFF